MNPTFAVAALICVSALALGCAAAVVVGRAGARAVRRRPRTEPAPEPRCSSCGAALAEHVASDWRRTTWQRGDIDA